MAEKSIQEVESSSVKERGKIAVIGRWERGKLIVALGNKIVIMFS